MNDNQNKINELLEKLETLVQRQDEFSKEINSLKYKIYKLSSSEENIVNERTESIIIDNDPVTDSDFIIENEEETINESISHEEIKEEQPEFSEPIVGETSEVKRSLEKFIGENLINKIGIAITVIGVAIGAKYSIENDLINPLTRIILGYLMGLALLGVGLKLKEKYEGYSAVLVSGAIAILYLITYFAYSFYGLIPQVMTFVIMMVFTAFAVVAAINYNRQVIAHIGLVGAYAIPFLLSTGSGKVEVLFSYMAIINIGVLIISFKKYWKGLFYSSFGFTWVIYFGWSIFKYSESEHFGLALTFLMVFFVIFYLTFLAYKTIRKEKFVIRDILLLFINSFIFYGIGYMILEGNETGRELLGLFTVFNGLIHFIVSVVIFRFKLVDEKLFYFVTALVLLFITIAIPVQLDGNWVTLFWVGEAALLFWIGRTKNIPVYEKLSYPLMLLAFLSIVQDWLPEPTFESTVARFTPLLNINFLSSILFISAFGFIYFVKNNKAYKSGISKQKGLSQIVHFAIPGIILFVCYFAFYMEIESYWDQLHSDSVIIPNSLAEDYSGEYRDFDLLLFKSIWLINYSLLFFSILSFFNLKKLKDQQLGWVNLILNTLVIVIFLVHGLLIISELRESYLDNNLSEYFDSGFYNILIRYISIGFYILLITATYLYVYSGFIKNNLKIPFDYLLHISVLWIASSELIHWLDFAQAAQSYKLGLSILWGIYALFLIILGIWKSKQHLRIGAFSLFGVTLIKLFFYDISHLNTISKTVVFVSLGILLLIISFLYNKYKHLISDENNS